MLVEIDVGELSVALGRLIDDPEGARVMGQRARQVALERYSAERMVDAYLALYSQALA
jgi:glycosyltransferase involved in cell wall biosynthesis